MNRRIVVAGEPNAKGRPRVTRHGRAYTPKATADWESHARAMAQIIMANDPPTQKAVVVEVDAYFVPSASWPRWKREQYVHCTNRKDVDNIAKAALDACTGIVWYDDCQVTALVARKKYATEARVEIWIDELDGHTTQTKKRPRQETG